MRRTVTAVTSLYAGVCSSGGFKTMKLKTLKAAIAATALLASGSALADVGVGVKAGTLGLGIEGRWEPPVPWFDLRVGMNRYDLGVNDDYSGIDYDATLAFDNYYLTANLKFPVSPFRFTVGAYSNSNELRLQSANNGDALIDIGGIPFPVDRVGGLRSTTSFEDTAPYVGVGFDFEVLGKAGLNLDFGVLWQGEPAVSLEATNWENLSAAEQALLGPALAEEQSELQNEISDYKAWPVVSLSFIYNF